MRPEELASMRESRRRWTVMALVAGAVYLWSSISTGFNPIDVVIGIPDMLNLVFRMLPPRWDYFPEVIPPLLQTAQMAILGTLVGAILAAPMMFLAAKNTAGHPLIYKLARGFLNLLRTVPDVLLATIFAYAVGTGPFAGVLALSVFSFGIITKLSCETIETVDQGPVEALRAVGAKPLNIIQYAIVPQILPNYIGYCIYMFEINVRTSTILGLVGGGGIGSVLLREMRWMNYRSASMIILVVFCVVAILDVLSTWIRGRLV